MASNRAVVLLSGGQDSTTCLFIAKMLHDGVQAVGVFYGQRHRAEVEAAGRIAALARVPYEVYAVPALGEIGGSALVDPSAELNPAGGYGDREAPDGLPTSFVPGRNALLFTVAAAVAVREGARTVYTGTCETDYSGYPDCRREFVDAMERALSLGMPSDCGPIRVHTPLMYLTKAETVRLARRLPGCWEALALSVTCYQGERPGCGKCPACVLRARGFAEAGEVDPAQYAMADG